MTTLDALVNDFAIRSFRDVADADYIAARMACRAGLVTQFLWASQQAIEKYLKCILVLNRITARDIGHDLGKALKRISTSRRLTLDLTKGTKDFIERLDECGRYRYFEFSNVGFGVDLVTLDRAVWEMRRYCTSAPEQRHKRLQDGFAAPRVRILGGHLEEIIDNVENRAREPLLWQNGFFGNRARRRVRLHEWFQAQNSPLSLNPHILDEVLKYVYLPKDVEEAYRAHAGP